MMTSQATNIPVSLQALAKRCGYHVETRFNTYVRGWPKASARPYLLYIATESGSAFLASFPTIDGLERSLRARAGC